MINNKKLFRPALIHIFKFHVEENISSWKCIRFFPDINFFRVPSLFCFSISMTLSHNWETTCVEEDGRGNNDTGFIRPYPHPLQRLARPQSGISTVHCSTENTTQLQPYTTPTPRPLPLPLPRPHPRRGCGTHLKWTQRRSGRAGVEKQQLRNEYSKLQWYIIDGLFSAPAIYSACLPSPASRNGESWNVTQIFWQIVMFLMVWQNDWLLCSCSPDRTGGKCWKWQGAMMKVPNRKCKSAEKSAGGKATDWLKRVFPYSGRVRDSTIDAHQFPRHFRDGPFVFHCINSIKVKKRKCKLIKQYTMWNKSTFYLVFWTILYDFSGRGKSTFSYVFTNIGSSCPYSLWDLEDHTDMAESSCLGRRCLPMAVTFIFG